MQALIKYKSYFYFEEKDDPVEEVEKVRVGIWSEGDGVKVWCDL